MRLHKNFREKKIWPVSDLDLDPGFGSGFGSGSETGSGSEKGSEFLFRIRNTGGSSTFCASPLIVNSQTLNHLSVDQKSYIFLGLPVR